jgi:hypothetical protein
LIKNINKVIRRNTITNVLITLVVVVAVIFIAAMSVQYAAAFSFKSWNELHPDEPLCYTLKTREERDACYDGIDPSTVRDNDNTVKNNPPSPPSSSSSEQQQKQKTTTTTTTTNTNFLTYKNSNHGLQFNILLTGKKTSTRLG